MSRLHRIRRQNRTRLTNVVPATRDLRQSLDFVENRRLRNLPDLRLTNQRERKRLRTVIDVPDNVLRLDRQRELRQAQDINRYNQIRQAQAKFARKPLFKINLDRSLTVDLPPEHPICIRREQRRQMMFVEGKAGKGGRKNRPPRDTNLIKVRCK